jgi:pimeloyl-ACP methyl ester carboxylesterase
LGLEKSALPGYSLGASAAIQHPEIASRMVLISIPFARQGWFPEVLAGIARAAALADVMKQSPIYKTYE